MIFPNFSSQNWAKHTGNCELETFTGEAQRQIVPICNVLTPLRCIVKQSDGRMTKYNGY